MASHNSPPASEQQSGGLQPRPQPPAQPYADYVPLPKPAPRGRRLLARIIDFVACGVLVAAINTPLILHLGSEYPELTTGQFEIRLIFFWLILLCLFFLYEALQLAKWSKTLGKMLTGLRVVSARPPDAPGAPLTAGQAFRRAGWYPLGFNVACVIPGLGLIGIADVVWHFWDQPLQQCLHDKMAKTMVIDDRADGPVPWPVA